MYRLKQLFGEKLVSRIFETQVVEVHARIAAMNTMTYLGMPVSVRRDNCGLMKMGIGQECPTVYLCTNALFKRSFYPYQVTAG